MQTQKSTLSIVEEKVNEFKAELNELVYRARKVNYKNNPPSLPKKPTLSTLTGFRKRLSNWKNQLITLEIEKSRTPIKNDPQLLKNFIK